MAWDIVFAWTTTEKNENRSLVISVKRSLIKKINGKLKHEECSWARTRVIKILISIHLSVNFRRGTDSVLQAMETFRCILVQVYRSDFKIWFETLRKSFLIGFYLLCQFPTWRILPREVPKDKKLRESCNYRISSLCQTNLRACF